MPSAQTNIHASTQQHLNLADVQEGLVLLKNGAVCLILQTTAINFGLLSEKEQEATIYAYAGFLNSLGFPIQIMVHSKQTDVSAYLGLIDEQLKIQKNEQLKLQTQKYRQFIESTVQKNKVLDKKFFIIIPYANVQFKKTSFKNVLEKAKADLYPKRDHLIGQFIRLGLKARQLNDREIINLFYEIYNSESEGQKFDQASGYQSSFVMPQKEILPLVSPTPPVPKLLGKKPVSKNQFNTNMVLPTDMNQLEEKKPVFAPENLQGEILQGKIEKIVNKVNPLLKTKSK